MSIVELPSTQRAIRTNADGQPIVDTKAPMPILENNMVLVKTKAVGLNLFDYKVPHQFPIPGLSIGCDFAGTIVAVGSAVRRPFSIGDRIFGGIHGANPAEPTSGAFAEYLVADADFIFSMPETMAWETAAAMSGIGIGTVGLALFYYLRPPGTLHQPAQNPAVVLVNGGATSAGTMALQLLKLAGLSPVATCSPKNFDMVKSYGAIQVFDYKDPNCAADIRRATKNSLKYILDPIASRQASELCYSAMGRLGGTYISLEISDLEKPRSTIKTDWVLGMSLLGKEVRMGSTFQRDANSKHRDFGIEYYKQIQVIIEKGKLRAHPPKVMHGGLQGILDEGLEVLRLGKVSGEKLVYFL
ncbi:GroES-like protein [Periconia macrospinosa]|uniref:GroES-like protein n=1 Tax=Periconia macrospinosa TaxID=97972 RepID=A0A2V1D0T5_9PLEO|nr:GroES-like protein [Periconia macrospinosa]